jgi:hypothetical protein
MMSRVRLDRIGTLCFAIVMFLLMLPQSALAEGIIRSKIDPVGFGNNIDDALLNPTEPGQTEIDLTEQVAGILHAIKMDGGRTVRWFVSSTWPQYRCSRDPENQATGEIDPAFFIISRVLLQQAKKEGIAVVVVLADTANGTFAGLPSNEEKRAAVIARWHQHAATLPPASETAPSAVDCEKSFQNGYHGRITPQAIFEDPELQTYFSNRFYKLAEYLKSFPALAALEMFNEPNFAESQKPEFGKAIARIRNLLYSKDPSLRAIPIYSGIAAWNENIARSLAAAGDLADEPYANAHYYTHVKATPEADTKAVIDLIAYLRRIVPGKPVIIAEAGSDDSIHEFRTHSDVLHAFLAAKKAGQIAMWMWGTLANDAIPQPDYKWEFTSMALPGGAFRDVLVAADREEGYRHGKSVAFTAASPGPGHKEQVTISQIPADDSNQQWRLRWQIDIGSERFISVSRAGILLRLSPKYNGVLAAPGPLIAIAARDQGKWAEISESGNTWQIKIYQCQEKATTSALPTPPYVPNYAGKLGNKSFRSCPQSSLVDSAQL